MSCRWCAEEAVDRLLAVGFNNEQATALAAAGYDVLGFVVLP